MNDSQRVRPAEVLLKVDDLHVAYGKAEVVHGVSMDVRKGEFVVILGRNGAGKSTLLHAVSGLIPKRSGRVTFGGRDITNPVSGCLLQLPQFVCALGGFTGCVTHHHFTTKIWNRQLPRPN